MITRLQPKEPWKLSTGLNSEENILKFRNLNLEMTDSPEVLPPAEVIEIEEMTETETEVEVAEEETIEGIETEIEKVEALNLLCSPK